MLIEQIHFPKIGPNWNKIIIISLACIAGGAIIYKVFLAPKNKTQPKPCKDERDAKEIIKETEKASLID